MKLLKSKAFAIAVMAAAILLSSVYGLSKRPEVEVVEGGPAAQAGLQAGDVITMIGSTVVTSQSDITSAVGSKSYSAGDTVTVTFVRAGQVMTTELTFGSTTEMASATTSQDTQQSDTQSGQGGNYPAAGDMEDFFNQFFGGRG